MKKIFIFFLCLIFCVSLALPAYAIGYGLSPALSVIKSKTEIKKCGVVNVDVVFSESDFDYVIGKAQYITFCTLPEKSAGVLTLGGKSLSAGQTITRNALGGIRFVPSVNTTSESSFIIKDAAAPDDKYAVCTVFVLENVNLSPVTTDCSFDTAKNISHKGYFAAKDPEGDKMTYSIVSSGRHGTLKLLDKASGLFIYTPKSDFTGRDIISFRAEDSYGNRSSVQKVTLHVTEPASDTVFFDLTNHWAHNSAIKACSDGVFGASVQNGKLMFLPDKEITRGDFLAIAMIAAGLERNVSKTYVTSFADDADIPYNIKSYASAAYSMGIFESSEKKPLRFDSLSPITRSEAAQLTEKILYSAGFQKSSQTQQLMRGVSPGDLALDKNLTRAEAAQLYCNITKYVNTEKKSKSFWERIISFVS